MFRKKKKKYEYIICYDYKTNNGEEGSQISIGQLVKKIKNIEDIKYIEEDMTKRINGHLAWVEITNITYLGREKTWGAGDE